MLITTKTYTRRTVMSYTHLTIEERSKIEVLYQEGYPISQIAKLLNRHRSTIYREDDVLLEFIKQAWHMLMQVLKDN